MRIEERTVYVIDGRTFNSEAEAQRYEEDCIGALIDEKLLTGIVYSPKDRLRLLDNLLNCRERLINLLTR